MRSRFLILFFFLPFFSKAQASYDEKVTSASNIGLTVSNLGLTGNAFKGNFNILKSPSCEFPRNSGIEHLFEGGLWIGAVVNGQVLVSTGAIDDASGYSTGKAGFEFTAAPGSVLKTRSSLTDNPDFSPSAVSHEDFYSDFTDSNTVVPGTTIPIVNHLNPLGVSVHFESYNWNYAFANFFVVLNFSITNKSKNTYDSLYIGYWADGVVRNINITPPGGAAFFNKGGNGYSDSLTMAYVFDAAGDTANTRSYFGLKYLGADDKYGFHYAGVDRTSVNYNCWIYNSAADPIYFSPSSDIQRYNKLSVGLNNNPYIKWSDVQPAIRMAGNRATLISAGPYHSLKPGETITVAFAIVCAGMNEDGHSVTADTKAQKKNFYSNAGWAQRTYDGEDVNQNGLLDKGEDRDGNGRITRYTLPSPPDVPRTKIIPRDHSIDIYWSNNSENSIDPLLNKKDFEGYRIYKSTFGFDVQSNADVQAAMQEIAQFDKEGDSLYFNTGFDSVRLEEPVKFDGDSVTYYYKYTINNLEDGWQTAVAITAFDMGDAANNLGSLESSQLATLVRTFPGKPANNSIKTKGPFVYPNPYYATAEWEGNRQFEEDRKIVFSNLPKHCTIKVYSPAGDLIKAINHNQDYNGSDIRWYSTYSDPKQTRFPGGEHGWDLLSDNNQIISRGLYIYTVSDLDSGQTTKGKFIIIK